jgi:predicted kinase
MGSTIPVSDVPQLAESLGMLPEPVARPVLIVVSGLPGTGKTYFARKLAGLIGAVVLESDALRKALFHRPVYSATESTRLFQAIHQLIEYLLQKGISPILDATNLAELFREQLYSIADRLESKLIIVRTEAPVEIVRERLKSRQNSTSNKSDADWQVYRRMRTRADRIGRNHYVVDTSRDITPVLQKIAREVRTL